MFTKGVVRDGVVVLENGVRLPEGQEVTVFIREPASGPAPGAGTHSILDIPTFNLGAVLQPLNGDDDLLGEMLEGRR